MRAARRLGAAAVLISMSALLAACGGGSSSSNASGSTSTAPQTSSAPASSPAVASSTKAASGGGSSTSFCQVAKAEQSQEAAEEKALVGDTPQQLSQYESKAVAELTKYTATAPSSIRSDVQVVVTAVQSLFKQLKAVNNDYTKLGPTALSSLDSPALTKATKAIETYLANSCGITEPTPAS
jgi:hypothetical protein